MSERYEIVPLTSAHRQGVIDIFNYYVEHSWAAFPETPVPVGFFEKMVAMIQGYPAVVVKDESSAVCGFAFLHPYYFDNSLRRTAEITYFLMPKTVRQGIGTKLLNDFTAKARNMGIDNFLACISSRNEESLRFHIKNGFVECGRFRDVGRKFGKDFDIVWMQKRL